MNSQPDQQPDQQAASSQPDPPGLTAEGVRATARDSSQPTQVLLGSPPSAGGAFGGEGGCCVEAGAELLKIPVETMRALLQVKLRDMNGDKTFLGDIDGDRYHHNVLSAVLQDRGYTLVMVQPSDYPAMFTTGKYFVYGELNFKFQPYTQHREKGTIKWLNQQCKTANFYGLERIPGANDAREYHSVAIRDGMLFCGNLVDDSGSRFGADAKQLLPLAGPSKDGQYRVQGKQFLAYLSRISRVFKLVCQPKPGARLASAVVTEALVTKKARVES